MDAAGESFSFLISYFEGFGVVKGSKTIELCMLGRKLEGAGGFFISWCPLENVFFV